LKNIKQESFSSHLLTWYYKNERSLPWRETKEPYPIWLSEVILQQTRVAQGLPYFNCFIEQYPNVTDLANAAEDEVLRLWQGLGYYSRARNLHKSAKIIAREHNGKFPETMNDLLALPGIGRYTAAAIASLAFNEKVPVVDGNVYRVLARYFAVDIDIASSKAFDHFYQLSSSLIDGTVPGDYNQALMEFGALQCKPANPNCDTCVLNDGCEAFANNNQGSFPVKRKKPKAHKRYFYYLVVRKDNKFLLRQRTDRDIWQGLYEFILIENDEIVKFNELEHPIFDAFKNIEAEFDVDDKLIRHLLTHQQLNVNFAVINIKVNSDFYHSLATDRYNWYSLEELEELPKPVLISKYLDTYLNSINLQ
jgi:A/G-specific adenine glycosylase